jgi:hypothetical protein
MAKKSKKSKSDWSKLRLMVTNESGNFEIMEVPTTLRMEYVRNFGVLTVRTKEELQNWLDSKNVL